MGDVIGRCRRWCLALVGCECNLALSNSITAIQCVGIRDIQSTYHITYLGCQGAMLCKMQLRILNSDIRSDSDLIGSSSPVRVGQSASQGFVFAPNNICFCFAHQHYVPASRFRE